MGGKPCDTQSRKKVQTENTHVFKMGLNPYIISPSRLLRESRMLAAHAWPFAVDLQMNLPTLLLKPWPRGR